MSGTTAQQEFMKVFHKEIKKPGIAEAVVEFVDKLSSGFFDSEYRAAVFQHHNSRVDLYDAYGFLVIHTLLCTGRFGIAKIPLGLAPRSDKSVTANRKLLSSLKPPFSATFYGEGGYGADGNLSWDKDIQMSYKTIGSGETVVKNEITCPPMETEFEVWLQRVEKTMLQLFQGGSLARWPYGYENIWLFVRRDLIDRSLMNAPEFGRFYVDTPI